MQNHRRETARSLTRQDLPAEFTADALRGVPLSVLRAASRPGNGVLDAAEQESFNDALQELMGEMAQRVRRQAGDRPGRTWPPRQDERRGGPASREERALQHLARRVEAQVGAVEELAPGVDWSFVRPATAEVEAGSPAPTTPAVETATVEELEKDLTDQMEMVQIMGDIAEVGRRTYDLEQQREASSTRSAFFGVLVSVAVIAAGWAPVVMATPHQRVQIAWLTVVTCVVAGAVYAVVRRRQVAQEKASQKD